MSSSPLSIDLISIIISFAPLHALPSLSGTNRDVASMALQATRSRLRDKATQAVGIIVPDDLVIGMGVTAVCKLIKAHDAIEEFLLDDSDTSPKFVPTSPECLSDDFGCFLCKDQEGNPSKLSTKGMILNPGKPAKKTYVCDGGDNEDDSDDDGPKGGQAGDGEGCRTRYVMYFEECRIPRGSSRRLCKVYVLRHAPILGRECERCGLEEGVNYCRFRGDREFYGTDDVFCCDCLYNDHDLECNCEHQCGTDNYEIVGGECRG